jgi:uncharacterized protein YwbE
MVDENNKSKGIKCKILLKAEQNSASITQSNCFYIGFSKFSTTQKSKN